MVKINLLPPRVRQARARRTMIAIGATIAVVALTVPLGLLYVRWAAVAALRQEVRRVDEESKAYAGIIDRIVDIENKEGALVKNLDVLDKLTAKQTLWIRFLESLYAAQQGAHDLWLTQVTSKALTAGVDAGKIEVTLQGTVFSAASFDVFVRALATGEMPMELSDKSPPAMTMTRIGTDPALNFTVTFRIKA